MKRKIDILHTIKWQRLDPVLVEGIPPTTTFRDLEHGLRKEDGVGLGLNLSCDTEQVWKHTICAVRVAARDTAIPWKPVKSDADRPEVLLVYHDPQFERNVNEPFLRHENL